MVFYTLYIYCVRSSPAFLKPFVGWLVSACVMFAIFFFNLSLN